MNLDLWTKVNGHYAQQGNTSDMIFPVYEILAYFSRYMRLLPGDILATGTPPGVGMGKNRFLDPGGRLLGHNVTTLYRDYTEHRPVPAASSHSNVDTGLGNCQ